MDVLSTRYVCVPCVPGVPCVCGAPGGQKRVLDPLKLEIQTAVSCCVYAKNGTGPLEKQPLLLTTWLSLQSQIILFFTIVNIK